MIQTLHALVMSNGQRITPTPYRNGQNIIKNSRSGAIVYMPPESKDVPKMMRDLVFGLKKTMDYQHRLLRPLPIINLQQFTLIIMVMVVSADY